MNVVSSGYIFDDKVLAVTCQVEALKQDLNMGSLDRDIIIEKIHSAMKDLVHIHRVFLCLFTPDVKQWYVKSLYALSSMGAELESGKAAYIAGKVCLVLAKGCKGCKQKALEYFALARSKGIEKASLRVALLMLTNDRELSDEQLSSIVSTLEKFKDREIDANLALATMSKWGKGLVKSDMRAKKLLNRCIKNGCAKAQSLYRIWYGEDGMANVPSLKAQGLCDEDREYMRSVYGISKDQASSIDKEYGL